ncbi:MAG: DUF2497 domain-containing protein [Pseudomonadota bacterium]|nr:DUF2497 domain-containing protein [Pseudomonadota bacterium]MEC9459570.1 DUF2497 domain-containing protein [Pseudomonadota bacterium]MED5436799.1 DUF2497 domain-containing protein [Pseudomonadota bacterium]
MDQNNEKDEPSVDEILSSIKDVIANDKTSFDEDVDDDNVFELTDIVDSDNVDTDEAKTNLEDSLSDALNGDEISLDSVIREAVKESLDDWFSRNLKPIVEESVKQEISKLFKKRN